MAAEHLPILSLYWGSLNAGRHQAELVAHKTQEVGAPGHPDGFLPLCPPAQGENPTGAGRTSEASAPVIRLQRGLPVPPPVPDGSAGVGTKDPRPSDTEAPQRVLPLVPLAKIASQAYVSAAREAG